MSILFHGRLRAVEGRGADLLAILSEQGDAVPILDMDGMTHQVLTPVAGLPD
ncbi:hypothetical protein [Kytococcus sp. Marseille-QA3725]